MRISLLYEKVARKMLLKSLPVFGVVRPHQLLVGVEEDAHLIVALRHPQRIGRCLDSRPNVVRRCLLLVLEFHIWLKKDRPFLV